MDFERDHNLATKEPPMNPTFTRRQFLGTTLTGALAGSAWATRGADVPGPRKLKLGLIGSGWYGMVDVQAAFKVGGVEVIAICDVDTQHLEESAAKIESAQGKRPLTFKRHEDLLRVEELEAVIIATPPHWHALQFIAALERGLDVYCEKPLAYDIREGRAMVDAARQSGRIIQIGFQRRQSPAIRQVRQYLAEGKAGRIVQVEAQINYQAGMRDTTPQPPPATLDWDLWCGPAPKLPYSPQVGHFAWRLEKEYGNGHLVDWGIHLIDGARLVMGATSPQTVQAAGGNFHFKNEITTPDTLTVQWQFPECLLTWRHRIWGAEEYAPEVNNGIFFYGEKQTVFVTDDRWIAIPRGKGKERQVHEAKADLGVLHMAEFLEAVRTRTQPGCTTEDGYRSTAAVQLGAIAYETGSKVHWDAGAELIRENPAAARLLKRDYRAPWRHPG
jgi:predicted dehydrogenase